MKNQNVKLYVVAHVDHFGCNSDKPDAGTLLETFQLSEAVKACESANKTATGGKYTIFEFVQKPKEDDGIILSINMTRFAEIIREGVEEGMWSDVIMDDLEGHFQFETILVQELKKIGANLKKAPFACRSKE